MSIFVIYLYLNRAFFHPENVVLSLLFTESILRYKFTFQGHPFDSDCTGLETLSPRQQSFY